MSGCRWETEVRCWGDKLSEVLIRKRLTGESSVSLQQHQKWQNVLEPVCQDHKTSQHIIWRFSTSQSATARRFWQNETFSSSLQATCCNWNYAGKKIGWGEFIFTALDTWLFTSEETSAAKKKIKSDVKTKPSSDHQLHVIRFTVKKGQTDG